MAAAKPLRKRRNRRRRKAPRRFQGLGDHRLGPPGPSPEGSGLGGLNPSKLPGLLSSGITGNNFQHFDTGARPLKSVTRRMIPQGPGGLLRLAYAAGVRVGYRETRFATGTYDRSHPSYWGRLDPESIHVIHVWFLGVFDVRTRANIPAPFRMFLIRRSEGIYRVRPYVSIKCMRYLISLHVRGQLKFDSIWDRSFKSFCRSPSVEFCIMLNQTDYVGFDEGGSVADSHSEDEGYPRFSSYIPDYQERAYSPSIGDDQYEHDYGLYPY